MVITPLAIRNPGAGREKTPLRSAKPD